MNIENKSKTENKSKNNKNNKNISECQELKNINYKSMLLNSNNSITTTTNTTSDLFSIEQALSAECKINKKEPWSKLDKTVKLQKLSDYVDKLGSEQNLSTIEKSHLNDYLIHSINRNRLIRTKEVLYDKENETIKNIPFLIFNTNTRKFTLKKLTKSSIIKTTQSDKTRKNKDKE